MKIKSLPAFSVIGIEARTTNVKEMSSEGIIGKQWHRAISENMFDRIPNRTDTNVLALYTDYESDANGEYSFLVGTKVNTNTSVPEELRIKEVPAQRYAVFMSEQGPIQQIVPEVWQRIWSTHASEMGGKRSYIADFEVYDERSMDPQNAIVEVWVGIK